MSSWYLGLLLACAIISAGDCAAPGKSSRSSSSGNTYTAPQCAPDGFYCPATSDCLPRTERCTGKIDNNVTANVRCKQKNYDKCYWLSGLKKFRARLWSTPLNIGPLGNVLSCLSDKANHHFVTYRGLMYEFGTYGTRIQDPLDPNYEYRSPGGRSSEYISSYVWSTCTYDELERYLGSWSKYKLCSRNCQHFASGLMKYIKGGCKVPSNGRKRQEVSDLELARYIYTLAGKNCAMTANQALPDTTQQAATQQTTTNAASQSIVSITVTFVVLTITLLIL